MTFLLVCSVVGLLIAPARAELPRLECPEHTGLGKPFFITVHLAEPPAELQVSWLDKELSPAVIKDGKEYKARVLLALGLKDKPGEHILRATIRDGKGTRTLERTVTADTIHYPEQHLTVPKKYTSLSKKALARHHKEKAKIRPVLMRITPVQYWRPPLLRPVPGSVSSVYGLRRFFNGEPRSPHRGIDLRGKAGTPIKAAGSGGVALVGEHYFAGKSVYIDHGMGVVSMYFHLSEIDVEAGQQVAAGDVIGKVGSTGRVTGSHVHFSVSVLGRLVDPLPLLEDNN